MSGCLTCQVVASVQIDEDSGEDKNLTVDLNSLFKDVTFEAAEEVTLAAGKPLSQVT